MNPERKVQPFNREDITFLSHEALCRAWFYRPAAPAGTPLPCVVMAHGLGGTRTAGLAPYAERFAAAGFGALVFDYRHFGDSEGDPRQLVSIRRQLQDWQSAIAFARGLPGVDPDRIALWGSSFSGGHVIVTAARDAKCGCSFSPGTHDGRLGGAGEFSEVRGSGEAAAVGRARGCWIRFGL